MEFQMLPRASVPPPSHRPSSNARISPAITARLRQPAVAAQPSQLAAPALPIATEAAAPTRRIDLENLYVTEPPAKQGLPSIQHFIDYFNRLDKSELKNIFKLNRYTKTQLIHLSILGMACLVFVAGVVLSIQTAQTNHAAAAEIQALRQH